MKKLAIVLTGISLLLAVIIASASIAGVSTPAGTSNVGWTPVISVQLATATLIDKNVPPPPDDTPKPHPDVDKCACKGTGVIKHGDGHETPCPYHAKDGGDRTWKCRCDSSGHYCACEEEYGKCQCEKSFDTSMKSRAPTMSFGSSLLNLFGGRRR